MRLDVTDRLADLRAGEAGVDVRYGGGRRPGLEAARLLAEKVFPVCSPGLLNEPMALHTPDDLRRHTHIHDATIRFDADFPSWPRWLAAAGVRHVDPGRGLRINTSAGMTQAAIAGQGVALGRSVVVADDLAAGRLLRLCPDVRCSVGWAYWIVHTSQNARLARFAAFRNWIAAKVQQGGRAGISPASPGADV